jgi:transcriptional regulator with XRE-family HTH domain
MLFVPQHIARCLFTMRGKSPNPIDEHAGLRVRMRRKMLSMSQTELGKGIGVTFQQVQKHEKGTTRIGASRLQEIAVFFTCRSRSFFEDPLKPGAQVDVRQAHSPGYMSDFLISADGLALSKSFMRIKYPKIRRRIIRLVEDIARNLD